MLVPLVLSRMKQEDHRFRQRVNACEIRSLFTVTTRATPRKIREAIIAPMLLGGDMLDVKSRFVVFLRQLTVFTAIAGPGDHLST